LSAGWIEGRFEGVYSGPRRPLVDSRGRRKKHRRAHASNEPRRFGFEIDSGHVRDLTNASAPDPEAIDSDRVIRQSRIKRVRLSEGDDPSADLETSLFDVYISDWQLKHPAESNGRAYGTIIGTIRARRRPSISNPAATHETVAPSQAAPLDEAASSAPISKRLRNEISESDDPAVVSTSLGWAEVALLVTLVCAAVGFICGARHAVAWLAPIATALGLFWLKPDGVVRGAPSWLTAAPTVLPAVVGWTPMAIAWQTGCWPVLGIVQLALLAVPLVLSAMLGSRGSLWMTGAIWTAILCSSCGGADAASCRMVPSADASTASETQPVNRPARRTDEQGRWPVMPPTAMPAVAPGPSLASDSSSVVSPGVETGPSAPSTPSVPASSPAPMLAPAPGALPIPDTTTQASAAHPSPPEEHATSGDRRLTQVDGGWLSPEHRRAPREHVLISIEQANRTPRLFFGSGGAHRVYLPTDPIFEDGSSSLRRDAPVMLARVAALLSLPSQPRVLLEVHSDSAGAPENQVALSQRRADNVRSWLIDRGHIPTSRFDTRAIGGARPLVPPDGDYGAQQPNRRIEIRIVE
jgi:outer membrane protein OmpA-like peptidoglycan-associated protein